MGAGADDVDQAVERNQSEEWRTGEVDHSARRLDMVPKKRGEDAQTEEKIYQIGCRESGKRGGGHRMDLASHRRLCHISSRMIHKGELNSSRA